MMQFGDFFPDITLNSFLRFQCICKLSTYGPASKARKSCHVALKAELSDSLVLWLQNPGLIFDRAVLVKLIHRQSPAHNIFNQI